jgi:Plasmid pRiA4b ORF-3-like protein
MSNTSTDGLPFLLDAAGGAPGYAEYLDAIRDPAHPEHEHMRLWGPEHSPDGENAVIR